MNDYFWMRQVEDKLDLILERLYTMADEFDTAISDLQAEVSRNAEVQASAVALIQGIADQLAAAADDPDQVRALAEQLRSQTDALASAVSENTPAADDADTDDGTS